MHTQSKELHYKDRYSFLLLIRTTHITATTMHPSISIRSNSIKPTRPLSMTTDVS